MIAAVHDRTQGHVLAAVTRTGLAPDPSLPKLTRPGRVAAGLAPGTAPVKTLSQGAHAANLLLGEGMGNKENVLILAASPRASLLRIVVLAPLHQIERGVHQLRRCVLAVPPQPRGAVTKTD